jgi:hypothetical protein
MGRQGFPFRLEPPELAMIINGIGRLKGLLGNIAAIDVGLD